MAKVQTPVKFTNVFKQFAPNVFCNGQVFCRSKIVPTASRRLPVAAAD